MSILVVMWATKQTKKGVAKADKEIKRRSQMRLEKRMTRLGLNPNDLSSLPDLSEDPFADPKSSIEKDHEEESREPIELPKPEILSALHPKDAAAVLQFVSFENDTRRKTFELRRTMSTPRIDYAFALDFKGSFVDEKEGSKEKYSGPPRAGFKRVNSKESSDDGEFNEKEGVKDMGSEKKSGRGTRFFRRISTLRRRSLMPAVLKKKPMGEVPRLSS